MRKPAWVVKTQAGLSPSDYDKRASLAVCLLALLILINFFKLSVDNTVIGL